VGGANRKADVITIQELLNIAHQKQGVPKEMLVVDGLVGPKTCGAILEFQKFQFDKSDGRVDPGQKTLAKLNEIAALAGPAGVAAPGSRFGISPAAPAGPGPAPNPAALSPYQLAVATAPLAWYWVNMALLRLSSIRAHFQHTLKFVDPAGNTHFHLDRSTPGNQLWHLGKAIETFRLAEFVLRNAPIYFRNGPYKANSFAEAYLGGYHLPADPVRNQIIILERFKECGPRARAAMLIHECAHFCGGINEIGHYARELPEPAGTPDQSPRNYAQLTPWEAVRNATSYAAFAIHAATGFDLRYGAKDISQ
jgi:hypothetical protein